jgi:hypothetical protein
MRDPPDWRSLAKALGSTKSDPEMATLDWYLEYHRLNWRQKAKALGSTMTDEGKTHVSWMCEYNELRYYGRSKRT